MARAIHKVDRNIGDQIRTSGGVSAPNVALLAGVYLLLQLVELLTGLWSLVLGDLAGIALPLGVTAVAWFVLSRVERRHGAHWALNAVRYWISRRYRYIYSPLAKPRHEPTVYDRLQE